MKTLKSFFSNQKNIFWYFVAILTLPCVLMAFTEYSPLLTHALRVVFPASLFLLVMTLFAKPGKGFWWTFLFSFFAAFQIVLLYLFGESPIAVDMFLNVVTTNVTEVDELLSQLWQSVVFVFVVYGGGIALSIVSLRSAETLSGPWRAKVRRVACTMLAAGLVLLGVNYTLYPRFALLDDIYPFNVTYNLGLSVDRFIKSARYEQNAASFYYHAQATRTDSVPEIYVLVIGETVRADNMSLYGYSKPTTPTLDELDRNPEAHFAVYRDAISASNTTHKSVPAMYTPVLSKLDYNGVYRSRGLISAFREAGFSTVYYSNQRRNHSLIDFLGCEAEEVFFTKDDLPLTENVLDEALVDLLGNRVNRVSEKEKLLIVLHTYGAHFDYRDRVPDGFGNSPKPFYPSAQKQYRPQLEQAYDNAIQYTDYVLTRIIGLLTATGRPAVMLYTSDHGEDIYDDSRDRFLHASPVPTYYQLRVPFFIWASSAWTERHPKQWQAVEAHRRQPVSTSAVVFHTMLDLAGIRADGLHPEYALSNPRFTPAKRLYINDHNELKTLDDCGFRPQDIEQFGKHHLRFP